MARPSARAAGGYREDAVDEMLDRVVELFLLIRRETADGQVRRPAAGPQPGFPPRDPSGRARPSADAGA